VPLPVLVGHTDQKLPVLVVGLVDPVEFPLEVVAPLPDLALVVMGDMFPVFALRGKEIPIHGRPILFLEGVDVGRKRGTREKTEVWKL
jgi:hypothetical protein